MMADRGDFRIVLPARPFYLIRHGQSEANAARITAGGQLDSPLTALGRSQPQKLAPLLHKKNLEIMPGYVYHSSMQRARDTAHILNQSLKLPMREIHDLREHDLGVWEGCPWDDIEPLLESGAVPPDGESEPLFSQRIQATLTPILNAGHEMPMIVAHGGLFHALGFLYEYAMSEVQNCHLHLFEPYPTSDIFPWRVWQFDIDGENLNRVAAPFCISHSMAHMIR